MRVLFTSSPGWGHIHPMVGLARAFLERGDSVLWVTGADACARLEREGLQTASAGLSERDAMSELDRQFPEIRTLPPLERPAYMFPRLFGTVRAAPMLADLIPAADAWLPTLVVCDAADFAGPIAAAVHRVPAVTHSFGALLLEERVAAASAVVAPLWTAHGLEPRPYGGFYDHLYLDIYPPSLQSPVRPHVPATQHLRPEMFATGGDEALPEWVTAASTPIAYVTFGTVFSNHTALATIVEALRELDLRAVVTVGPHGDPASLGPQPSNVHVARYIPQRQLLPHCSVVVSHAGSGTFLAALSAEIPQLCVPQAADQFLNAAACARSGIGLSLEPGSVTVEEVRDAVARLLSESSFRAASGRVSREIAAMPSARGRRPIARRVRLNRVSASGCRVPRGDGDLPRDRAGVTKAKALIDSRRYVQRSRWADAQPSAQDENAFLQSHTWKEYGEWHLAINVAAKENTKARYAFGFGDFRRIHRMGLIACHYRAAEWHHKEVELAAHRLLQYLDKNR